VRSERRNIAALSPRSARSQNDFLDGFARRMWDALPNASFIGFSYTLIEKDGANVVAGAVF